MSNELRRRAAFWRNMEYSLDQMLDEVQARGGDKWFDREDANSTMALSTHLGGALCTVRKRYIEVLQSQIADWNMGQGED